MSPAGPGASGVEPSGATSEPRRLVVAVLPDLTGIDKRFDYEVPPEFASRAVLGAIVRVPLQGRRVRGWVVGVDVEPDAGVTLRPIVDVISLGPPVEVLELARFGAWRYAGRLRPFLVAASPPTLVRSVPPRLHPPERVHSDSPAVSVVATSVAQALALSCAVLRLPPASPRLGVVTEVLDTIAAVSKRTRDVLVLTPERWESETLSRRLERRGDPTAIVPDAWMQAAAGGRVVIGSRGAVLAPVRELGAIVVLDAHAESYTEERAPTWNAAVLAVERARLASIPCLLVSACPPLELLTLGGLVEVPRTFERAGWPPLEVIDQRSEDPRSGRYSPRLAPLIADALVAHPDLPALCVLNRVGRGRLMACAGCGEILRCAHCGGALGDGPPPESAIGASLDCLRCHLQTARICDHCGSTRLKTLRVGVSRAAEELAGLTGRPVAEVSGRAKEDLGDLRGRLVIGTQAVLHRLRAASLVVFLDFDQELLATRYGANEDALALLARSARLVGGRDLVGRDTPGPGRIVVQTRLPEHEVIRAALHGDPTIASEAELVRRDELGLPPARALAIVSGPGARELVATLGNTVEVATMDPDRYLVRGADSSTLADALAGARVLGPRPRIDVDPRTT